MPNFLKKPDQYSPPDEKTNLKKNLAQHLQNAIDEKDQVKIDLIKNLEKEIEKFFVLKSVSENKELSDFFKDDVANVTKDGSFNIIKMILIKEIELLEIGDFQAIEMLNKIKNKAQSKIIELNKIAINFHEQQKLNNNSKFAFYPVIEKSVAKPKIEYKTLIPIEGFHIEKTLGGEYIQALDADIKNLVGSEIINSKPEELSKAVIDQIKNIRQGQDLTNQESKSAYGHWSEKAKENLNDINGHEKTR